MDDLIGMFGADPLVEDIDESTLEEHYSDESIAASNATTALSLAAGRPAKRPKQAPTKNKSPKNPYPWSDDIYVTIKRSEVGGKKSTEEGFRPIWHHWAVFCKANNKPVYVSEFGLQLYSERIILDPTVEGNKVAQQLIDLNYDAQRYDSERIIAFFSYLVELADPPVTYDTLTKAKGFNESSFTVGVCCTSESVKRSN